LKLWESLSKKICPFFLGKLISELNNEAKTEFEYFFRTDSFSLIISPSLNSISTIFSVSFSSFLFFTLISSLSLISFIFKSLFPDKNSCFNCSFFILFCFENSFLKFPKFFILFCIESFSFIISFL